MNRTCSSSIRTRRWLLGKLSVGVVVAVVVASGVSAHAETPDGAATCAQGATIAGLSQGARDALKVRAGPGRTRKVIGRLKLGDAVRICSTNGGWMQVAYAEGQSGWVSSRFIKLESNVDGSAEAAPASPPPADAPSSPAQAKSSPAPVVAAVASPEAVVPRPQPRPERSSAFARRDYSLGMSLTEFRSAAYPDTGEVPDVFVVCSDDEEAAAKGYSEVRIAAAFTKAGVTKCVHYYMLDFGLSKVPMPAGVGLGSRLVSTEFYFLAPEGEREKRLFWIETRGPTNVADAMLPSFVKEYGEPADERTEPWLSKSGAKFDNTIRVWKNDVSEVEFRRLGSTLNGFELEHRFLPLMDLFNHRAARRASGTARRS